MEYIRKQATPPADWDIWFTTASNRRSFDYAADYKTMTLLVNAKNWLLQEQNHLCAYCQQKLITDTSSIEHLIPKELNIELSTNYYNLVAVCKSPPKDPETGRSHCDKEKQSHIITSLLFVSNNSAGAGRNNAWFDAHSEGSIIAKRNGTPGNIKQAEAYIEILNLNHKLLKGSRAKDAFDPYLQVFQMLPKEQRNNIYWRTIYERILRDPAKPFRQYLLIVIGSKLGYN